MSWIDSIWKLLGALALLLGAAGGLARAVLADARRKDHVDERIDGHQETLAKLERRLDSIEAMIREASERGSEKHGEVMVKVSTLLQEVAVLKDRSQRGT